MLQGIEKEIAKKYDLEVKNIAPCRDSFIIDTDKGRMLLKRAMPPPGRIWFVHGAKEHLYANGFTNIDRYRCTLEGEPYFTYDQCYWTLSDVIEGRECNFDSRDDVAVAATTLARLHKASRGYVPLKNSIVQDELGKLPMYLQKRLSEMKRLKSIAKKGKYKFDYLLLNYIDYFYELGESVVRELANSNYERLVEEARERRSFCHHDYTHSNIIIGDGKVSVINFDYCRFEIEIYDIANLIRRKMRKCDWDINEAAVILDSYRAVKPLSKDEFAVLKLMLKFPQKFWRVANRFYNSKRSWAERCYTQKLQETIDEIDCHRAFIEKFDMLA